MLSPSSAVSSSTGSLASESSSCCWGCWSSSGVVHASSSPSSRIPTLEFELLQHAEYKATGAELSSNKPMIDTVGSFALAHDNVRVEAFNKWIWGIYDKKLVELGLKTKHSLKDTIDLQLFLLRAEKSSFGERVNEKKNRYALVSKLFLRSTKVFSSLHLRERDASSDKDWDITLKLDTSGYISSYMTNFFEGFSELGQPVLAGFEPKELVLEPSTWWKREGKLDASAAKLVILLGPTCHMTQRVSSFRVQLSSCAERQLSCITMIGAKIPRCIPCEREFPDTRARQIHIKRHCPFKGRPQTSKCAKFADVIEEAEGNQEDEGESAIDIVDSIEIPPIPDIEAQPVDAPEDSEPPRRSRKLPGRYENLVISNLSALRKATRVLTKNPTQEPDSIRPPSPADADVPMQADPLPCSSEPHNSSIPNDGPTLFNYKTEPNEFGLFKVYESVLPSSDPDEQVDLDQAADALTFTSNSIVHDSTRSYSRCFGITITSDEMSDISLNPSTAPFLNHSIFLLMNWYYQFPKHSVKMLNSLVNGVIRNPDFKISELKNFSARNEIARLDAHHAARVADGDHPIPPSSSPSDTPLDGWYQTSLSIPLPRSRVKQPESAAPMLTIDGLWYRKPLEVIKEAFMDPISVEYHLRGHKVFWKRSENEPIQRVHSELYTSDRLLEMEREVRLGPVPPGEHVETVVVPIQLYSDSTLVSMVGNISVWPIYLYIGNLSKYVSMKPSSFSENHLAYIPSSIKTAYRRIYGKPPTAAELTHLKRELMQAVWHKILNDDELIEAFKNGIVITFFDGIYRRIIIRWFTYSADYPEKFLGYFSSVYVSSVIQLGQKRDMRRRITKPRVDDEARQSRVEKARELIFKKGCALTSDAVKHALGEGSWTSTRNAFSEIFAQFGFDYFKMFAGDILHEFDIGVRKDVFIHLTRILAALDSALIEELDDRETIRRISRNVSEFKRTTAREYEDYLQTAMAVFEGLTPEPHNKIILSFLWDLACFQAYAKLRLCTDSCILSFKDKLQDLGNSLREFYRKTCAEFETRELKKEQEKRLRQQAKAREKSGDESPVDPASELPQKRSFNPNTSKWHALGDYPDSVQYYGTADNHSTQKGEHGHIRTKRLWERTAKNRFSTGQLGRAERRDSYIHKRRVFIASCGSTRPVRRNFSTNVEDAEALSPCDPSLPYQIANSQRLHEDIHILLRNNENDPAMRTFLVDLKNHCLQRILGTESCAEFTDADRSQVVFFNNYLYKHKYLRINFTRYDGRREQDSINPRTHPDIMVLSGDGEDHPYWYGRVISIFHVRVRHIGAKSHSMAEKRLDIAWIRWYRHDASYRAGWQAKRLHRLQFFDAGDPDAFGFVDPAQIIRAIHILPGFAYGWTDRYLPADSVARQYQQYIEGQYELETDDYKYYYVGISRPVHAISWWWSWSSGNARTYEGI
ncbi:hypothetical protein D9758_015877 [Tetrapyrgos nigripes]|uniref:C2H2-type domain-containing protein n=1 Tax=Tetrapyrgos nigripes TaxID=182062 RepID=A0A8H5CJ79_9AGAR|nr:hypothetical protein D9758_015877 [Tetrapyrgos nigripes]